MAENFRGRKGIIIGGGASGLMAAITAAEQHGDCTAARTVEAVVKTDGHSDEKGAEHIRQDQRFFRIGIVPGVLHKDHEDRGEWKQYH